MKTHRTVRVGDHAIGLTLELLAEERRVPMATSIAWFYVTCAAEGEAVNAAAWQAFLRDIISPSVDFQINGIELDALSGSFWMEAIHQATKAFVEENALRGLIEEQLPSIYREAQTVRTAS
jgi:hypothetical protein